MNKYIILTLLALCASGCLAKNNHGNLLSEKTGGRAPSGNHSTQGVLKGITPCGDGTFIFKLEKGMPNPVEYLVIVRISSMDNYELKIGYDYLFIMNEYGFLIKALDEYDRKERLN